MMNILMPCAGKYSRFPSDMPKYIRPLNDLQPMFVWALRSIMAYPDSVKVFFAIRKEDEDNHGITGVIKHYTRDSQVMVLDRDTSGPAHTVVEMLKYFDIQSRFIVKDCDCHLRPEKWPEGNAVYVAWRETAVGDRGSKSWVEMDKYGKVVSIKEKDAPTDWYCHGAYQFNNPKDFIEAYDIISEHHKEVFCSHIIDTMISWNVLFEATKCTECHDWGTWDKYIEWRKQRKVYLFDIDGVLVCAGSPVGKRRLWGDSIPLSGVKEKMYALKEKGCSIILTTSRPSEYAEQTEKILRDNGICFDRVIYDLPLGARVLINDYDVSNPYPSAEAINTKRDSGDWIEKI